MWLRLGLEFILLLFNNFKDMRVPQEPCKRLFLCLKSVNLKPYLIKIMVRESN